MSVAVEGERRRLVAEELLQGLDVRSRADRQGCTGVPQVVQAYPDKIGGLNMSFGTKLLYFVLRRLHP